MDASAKISQILKGKVDQPPSEIRKSILILKAQQKSLLAVESFLRNREWRIHSVTDLKQFLQALVTQKPSFVMITVDHTNKKVKALPKLLSQAFPVYTIVFSETSTTSSYKGLMESGCNYRINPPATGPAVERTINKIMRDRELEEERRRIAAEAAANPQNQAANNNNAASGPGGTTVLSGAGGPANEQGAGFINFQGDQNAGGFNMQSAADMLKQMSDSKEGDDGDDTAAFLNALQQQGQNAAGMMPAGGLGGGGGAGDPISQGAALGNSPAGFVGQDPSGATMRGPNGLQDPSGAPGFMGSLDGGGGGPGTYMPNADGSSAPAPGMPGYDPALHGPGAPGMQARGKSSGGGWVPGEAPGKGRNQNPSANDGEAAPLANDPILEKKPRQGIEAPDALLRPSGSMGAPQVRYDENDIESAAPLAPSLSFDAPEMRHEGKDAVAPVYEAPEYKGQGAKDEIREALNKDVRRIGGNAKPLTPEESSNIILRGTQRALDESVNLQDGRVTQKLEGSSNVACLIIESPKFSGYLVAALGKNRKIDEKFMNTIRERLTKFLKEAGEPIKDDEPMSLKIRAVDFEGWALECAEFLRKSVHEGEEIAMAFFPFAEATTTVESSAQADMGAVKLDELTADVQVDFNVYVYLPANNKYVLYTPRGSKFYASQKDRLHKMGVTHMHIKRTELQDVSRYRAQNYLNSKVNEYEENQKKKKTPAAG